MPSYLQKSAAVVGQVIRFDGPFLVRQKGVEEEDSSSASDSVKFSRSGH